MQRKPRRRFTTMTLRSGAAPDLLAALRSIIESSDANCGDSLANAISAARAAIARATGGQ
jgi:hypothetical protein